MSWFPETGARRAATLGLAAVLALRLIISGCNAVLACLPQGLAGPCSLLVPFAAVGLPFWLFRYCMEAESFAARLPAGRFPHPVVLVPLFGAAAFLGQTASVLLARRSPSASEALPTGSALFWYALANVLLTPILEEWAFRGVLLHALRHYGDVFAVVFSSLLFALAHAQPILWPTAFLCGVVLALCFLRTRRLWLSSALHILYNFIQLILLVK